MASSWAIRTGWPSTPAPARRPAARLRTTCSGRSSCCRARRRRPGVVPEADQRARAVAVESDRMRVVGAVDLARLHAFTRGREHPVAPARSRPSGCPAWRRPRRAPGEARLRVGLSLAQHVGHVLGVGVQPRNRDADIQCSTSLRWMTGLSPSSAADVLALHIDARLEPGAEPLHALAPPPHQVARLRRAGHDRLRRGTSPGSTTR